MNNGMALLVIFPIRCWWKLFGGTDGIFLFTYLFYYPLPLTVKEISVSEISSLNSRSYNLTEEIL